MTSGRGWVVGALLGLASCSSPHAHPVRTPAPSVVGTQCDPGGLTPSRSAFLSEALFAAPTPRTPRFDDYTKGSYHVEKLDLLAGLEEQSVRCGLKLRAVLVIGPMGMLWAYHVVVLLDEGDHVRINSLVMPHARITGKVTGVVSRDEASARLAAIIASPGMAPGIPSTSLKEERSPEFSYRLALVTFDDPQGARYHALTSGMFPNAEEKRLLESVNRLLEKASSTTYPPDTAREQ